MINNEVEVTALEVLIVKGCDIVRVIGDDCSIYIIYPLGGFSKLNLFNLTAKEMDFVIRYTSKPENSLACTVYSNATEDPIVELKGIKYLNLNSRFDEGFLDECID